MTVDRSIGTGAVGYGGIPSEYRKTPEKCADLGHPGVTYNALHDVTACLCGARWFDGREDTVDDHLACCGGPLTERTDA